MRRAAVLFRISALSALSAACASPGLTRPKAEAAGALHGPVARADADATVRGSRIVPESAEGERALGVEPGGGARTIVQGMRLVTLASGAVLSADDRLPERPQAILPVPDRLGGGFLFQNGNTLRYAERWLATARPVFQASSSIQRVFVGLDRVYVRLMSGATLAFDPSSGDALDLGPWPATPFVVAYAAADAWRAVAATDWRGVVATNDAGATWRPLDLPLDAREVSFNGDALIVSGRGADGGNVVYEIRGDGQVGQLATHRTARAAPPAPARVAASLLDPAARPFGAQPLAAAVEDGWPVEGGAALVARDGSLARVRLSDGALLDAVEGAYPLKPSSCHAVSLSRDDDRGAFGFVCGEAHGRTAVYRWDGPSGRMVPLITFTRPRVVLSSGNGALAVRGACAADAPSDDADRRQQSYCLLPRDDAWREIRVSGDIGGERVVVLRDGRVAVLSPPRSDLTTARLTLLDHGRASTIGLAFPSLPKDVMRHLRYGTWLDGFEEGAPGILHGWVEANGSLLGVQIGIDGHTKYGRYIRDSGTTLVSGRYGLGWAASGRGYETTDYGMTWTDVTLPAPLVTDARRLGPRACGPIGCTAVGWLRVGWGESLGGADKDDGSPPTASPPPYRPPQQLVMTCEATARESAPPPPAPGTKNGNGNGARPRFPPRFAGPYGGFGSWQPLTELPPLFAEPGPAMGKEEVGLAIDVSVPTDRGARTNNLAARFYAWGPKSEDWARTGRWTVRWLWPFGGFPEVRSTPIAVSPFANLDAARRAIGYAPGLAPLLWTFASGDDADHGLLLGTRPGSAGDVQMFALDANHPPLAVRRADGQPMPEVVAWTRMTGHWYVATAQAPLELPATVVWQIEGSFAREVARVPRSAMEAVRLPVRLARRADGGALGLVVDGPPEPDHLSLMRWVLPLDVETWDMGDPVKLGPVDFSDRALHACADDAPGWVFDAPLASSVWVTYGRSSRAIGAGAARLRVTTDEACIERLQAEGWAEVPDATHANDAAPAVRVSLLHDSTRTPLRCIVRP